MSLEVKNLERVIFVAYQGDQGLWLCQNSADRPCSVSIPRNNPRDRHASRDLGASRAFLTYAARGSVLVLYSKYLYLEGSQSAVWLKFLCTKPVLPNLFRLAALHRRAL